MSTDLLILNGSNYPQYPVYPYAFVQVRAVGARHEVNVRGHDLMGIPPSGLRQHLREVLARHRPRAVGVHVRQADSLLLREYHPRAQPKGYFPLSDTANVVEILRSLTDAPILAGGFGLSTQPERVLRKIGVDFAINGEPDAMLASFDDVIDRGTFASVDNLIFRGAAGIQMAPRTYFPPLDDREYDQQAFDDLARFYGTRALRHPGGPTVAVELARGCPYRCYFCTEPSVKGRKVRVRDLDAVMGDVAFLASQGVRRFWLVCSELNVGKTELAVEVAYRFLKFNEGRSEPVSWRAYILPRWLEREQLELMYRSGFGGGWNDFPSLDDENLKATRVPYRASDVVEHARTISEVAPQRTDGQPTKIGLFLGNAFASPKTIARSLARFDEELSGRFAEVDVGAGTRLFESIVDVVGSESLSRATTYQPTGPVQEVDITDPTFFLPSELVDTLGGESHVLDFFQYAERTLLARSHRKQRDWCRFLRRSMPLGQLRERLGDDFEDAMPSNIPDAVRERLARARGSAIGELLDPPQGPTPLEQASAFVLCELLRSRPCEGFSVVLAELGVEIDALQRAVTTPFRLLRAILSSYSRSEDLFARIDDDEQLEDRPLIRWRMQRLIHEHDIRIDPRFRPFIVDPAA